MHIQLLEDLCQLKALYNQEKFAEAFRLLEKLLECYPYSVELLVIRGKIIQVLDDYPENIDLETAKESLKIANLISPKSIEPCIELGYLEYVLNHSEDAINYFYTARENAELSLKSALIGEIKCYIDMRNIFSAREVMEKAKLFFPDDSEIGILEFELEEYEH